MMIDTGAQSTIVEKQIATQLGLKPIRFAPMIGVSQKPELCPVYLMSITILVSGDGMEGSVTFNNEVVGMSSPVRPQPHVGLLGRDFLSHMTLVYEGPKGSFELIPSMQLPPKTQPVHESPVKSKRRAPRKARKKARR